MGPKCYISLSTLVNPPRHYLFCHDISVELTHCAMTRVTSVAYSSSELNPKILKSSKIYPKLLSSDLFPGNNKDTWQGFHWMETSQDQSFCQQQQTQKSPPKANDRGSFPVFLAGLFYALPQPQLVACVPSMGVNSDVSDSCHVVSRTQLIRQINQYSFSVIKAVWGIFMYFSL